MALPVNRRSKQQSLGSRLSRPAAHSARMLCYSKRSPRPSPGSMVAEHWIIVLGDQRANMPRIANTVNIAISQKQRRDLGLHLRARLRVAAQYGSAQAIERRRLTLGVKTMVEV